MIGNARPAAEARSRNFRRETVPVNKSSKSSFMNLLPMFDKLQFVLFLVSICVETNSVNDKLKFIGLFLLRHPDLDAVLFQLSDKDLPDCRIFILVFDQVATFARTGLAQAMRSSATAQR